MSSVEIEDVLASIRRLVSEDLRPQARAAAASGSAPGAASVSGPAAGATPAPAAAPHRQPGRLLLTPALRVVPTAEARPDPAPQAAAPQHPETQPDPQPEAEQPSATVFGFPPRGIWPTPEVVEVDLDLVEEAEIVEAPFIALDDEDDRMAEAWADGAWPEPASPRAQPFVGQAFPEVVVPFPSDAALQPPVAPPAPQNDPLRDARLAELAEAAALAEIQAAEAHAAQEAAASAARLRQDNDLLGEEDFLIDEDVMRELVRDIIREELQGALGERITRNVRKLVRAEIQRMLICRDLD